MESIKLRLLRFLYDEEAPTFLEYGLLIIVIALVVVAAAAALGTSVSQMFQGPTSWN